MDKNQQAFFALLRAGLWDKEVRLSSHEDIDYSVVYRLSEEQSVIGLVAGGLEHIIDTSVPKKDVMQFIGHTLQLEQQNSAMNYFIGVIVEKMRDAGIHVLLIKGQGVAQCYEKPLWRSCGDVDFFLDADNYEKAKAFLTPLASSIEQERIEAKHLGMTIDPWVVELHGTMHCRLSNRINKGLDIVQRDVFYNGAVRTWQNGNTEITLPSADNDAIYILTHILSHFYQGGIGLRQICDWCRLLWTYRESLNYGLLESRIRKMGLMTVWKAFGAFSVEYLGMPKEAMPFYSTEAKWKRKADRMCSFIIEVGNFGHNRDMSYYSRYPYLQRKVISLGQRFGDLIHHARIFPMDTMHFFPRLMFNGLKSAIKKEG